MTGERRRPTKVYVTQLVFEKAPFCSTTRMVNFQLYEPRFHRRYPLTAREEEVT